jgi:hypothetical protein
MPSQAEIQCECAFTYMNARCRQNLSDAATAGMNRARSRRRKGGGLDSVIAMALSRRTIVTCMWGVSDPLRAGRGAKKGAAKWGSLTPPLSLCSAATAGGLRYRRHRAPPGRAPKSQTGKNMNARFLAQGEHVASSVRRLLGRATGTVLPSFGSPTLFPLRRSRRR